MTILLVGAAVSTPTTGATALPATITGVTAGNGLLVCVTSSKSITSLVDSAGSTPQLLRSQSNVDLPTYSGTLYLIPNVAGGTHTITANLSASGSGNVVVQEVSGLFAAMLDKSNGQGGNSIVVNTGTTGALSTPVELVVVLAQNCNGTFSSTAPAGFTVIASSAFAGSSGFSLAYKIVGSATSMNPAWSTPAAAYEHANVVVTLIPMPIVVSLAVSSTLLAAAGARLRASLSGASAFGGAPTLSTRIAAALVSSAGFSGTTDNGRMLGARLASASSVSGSALMRSPLAAALSSQATVSAALSVRLSAALADVGKFKGTLKVKSKSSANLVSSSTLTAAPLIAKHFGLNVVDSGLVFAVPVMFLMCSAQLSSSSRLTGAPGARLRAALADRSALTASGGVRLPAAAALTSRSSIVAPLRAEFRARAALASRSSLSATIDTRVRFAATLRSSSAFSPGARGLVIRTGATLVSASTLAPRLVVGRLGARLASSSTLTAFPALRTRLQLAMRPDVGSVLSARATARLRAALVDHSTIGGRLIAGVALAAALRNSSTIGLNLSHGIRLSAALAGRSRLGAGVMQQHLGLVAALHTPMGLRALVMVAAAVDPLHEAAPGRRIELVALPRSWNVTAASVPVARRGGRRTG